jgi:hypothetical protein
MKTKTQNYDANPGNWTTTNDCLPIIEVDQETHEVTISLAGTTGYQKKACVDSSLDRVAMSPECDQLLIVGEVVVKNWVHWQCSKTQKFVFALFVGDSGHIYTHRAPATKGWRELDPSKIRKRLVKLGVGSTSGVIQQGDFLLKPANGFSLPVEDFRHEWESASHHKFSEPVLSEYVPRVGRVIYIPAGRTVELHHEAVDGIQHPMQVVPEGQWVIGSTASQLRHSNARD